MDDKEYIKSRFRCPICGELAGCTKDGKVGLMSTKAFRRHIQNCRKKNGVKFEKEHDRQ